MYSQVLENRQSTRGLAANWNRIARGITVTGQAQGIAREYKKVEPNWLSALLIPSVATSMQP